MPRAAIAAVMLAVFTVSVGYGIVLPLLPYLIERLPRRRGRQGGSGGWGNGPADRRLQPGPLCVRTLLGTIVRRARPT